VADDDPLRDFADRAIPQALRYSQHLRSLLHQAVPTLADGFDCDRVDFLEREFPLDDWRRRESDLLCLIPYRTGTEEVSTLVCVLIEHQSRPDPLMPLRTLLYAVLFWEREWKQWEQLPEPRPRFRLTPLLPIVFHTGLQKWRKNQELKDLLDEPEAFHVFAPRWQPLFWHLASRSPQALIDSADEWLQSLAIIRAEKASREEFAQVYKAVLEHLQRLAAQEKVRYYELLKMIFTWGLWRRPPTESQDLMDAAVDSQRNAVRRKEVRTMARSLGQLLLEKGRREGEKKGEKKGQKQGELLALRDSLRILLEERLGALPEAVQQRLQATTNAAKLRACLRQAVHINSLEELKL
jgi:hypothetical protein